MPRYFDESVAIVETSNGEIKAYNRMPAIPPVRKFYSDFFYNNGLNTTAPRGEFNTADIGFFVSCSGIHGNKIDDKDLLTGIIKQKVATYYF